MSCVTGDTDVPECVDIWWHFIITHLSPAVGKNLTLVSIQDLLGLSLLFDAECQSFRQQLLLRLRSRLEVMISGTPQSMEQIEVPDGLYAVEPPFDGDESRSWSRRDRLAL